MGDVVGFDVNSDPKEWITVPTEFPNAMFASAQEWAESLVAHFDLQNADQAEVREQLLGVATLFATVEPPLPGATGRYWFIGGADAFQCLVHAYAMENIDGVEDARELAVAGYESAMLVHQDRIKHTAFDSTFEASLLFGDENSHQHVTIARCIGVSTDWIVIFDLADHRAAVVGGVAPYLRRLFEGITPVLKNQV